MKKPPQTKQKQPSAAVENTSRKRYSLKELKAILPKPEKHITDAQIEKAKVEYWIRKLKND